MIGNCSERVTSFVQYAFNLISDIKVGKYSVKTITQESLDLAIGAVNENKHYYEDGVKKYQEVTDKINTKKQEYTNRANEAKNYIQSIIAQILGLLLYLFDAFFGEYVKVAQDKAQAARSQLNTRLEEANAFAKDKISKQKEYVQTRVNALEQTVKEKVTHQRQELLTKVEELKDLAQPYVAQAKPYVEQAVVYAQPLVERAKPYLERVTPYVRPYVERLLILVDRYEIPFLREWIEDLVVKPAKPIELIRLDEELKVIREETAPATADDNATILKEEE